MEEKVVLINQNDEVLGLMEKQEAHIAGLLHRAFSVFIFNDKDELLIQRRAMEKYHSPGLWANTCCSHPRENETYKEAAHRRMMEEMGFDCELKFLFSFIYKSDVGGGLTEHELDNVFIGKYNNEPIIINKEEVSEYKWIDIPNLIKDIENTPEKYTEWFKIIFKEYLHHLSL